MEVTNIIWKEGVPGAHLLVSLSDRRGSNPRPSAWEANALPTEPLSHLLTCAKIRKNTFKRVHPDK